jgi:hypothetical protein
MEANDLPDRRPYVGEGVDGASRSAQIDREEADALPPGDQREERVASADRWEAQTPAAVERLGDHRYDDGHRKAAGYDVDKEPCGPTR